jgi:hypothetical protein
MRPRTIVYRNRSRTEPPSGKEQGHHLLAGAALQAAQTPQNPVPGRLAFGAMGDKVNGRKPKHRQSDMGFEVGRKIMDSQGTGPSTQRFHSWDPRNVGDAG